MLMDLISSTANAECLGKLSVVMFIPSPGNMRHLEPYPDDTTFHSILNSRNFTDIPAKGATLSFYIGSAQCNVSHAVRKDRIAILKAHIDALFAPWITCGVLKTVYGTFPT